MDADTARLLLDEGLPLLAELPGYVEADALALGTRLRAAGHEPDLVAAVLSQARLRARARGKFGADADRMLFTPDGLEQATRREVADLHAARFTAAGITWVHDLGCGLGADALAMIRTGLTVSAVDADEATALLADHNLHAVHPDARSDARCARAEDVTPAPEDGVWFDPARRTPGRTDATGRTRRTFRLEDMTPTWATVLATAEHVPATGAKLSPAFPHAAIPAGAEAEWVSTAGDLVECAVWWGPLVHTAGRTATILRADATHRVTEADTADAPPPGVITPTEGVFLYEPDLAVHQAGLVGALARTVDGCEIAPGMGYVLSPHEADVPYARRHTVSAVMPANPKAVKGWMASRGLTGLTIKRRGGTLEPDDLRRRLKLGTRGGDQATLLLTVGPDGPLALALT